MSLHSILLTPGRSLWILITGLAATTICAAEKPTGHLVIIGGGLSDLHIWFYALLVMVALYQLWTPFLLAVAFVAVHHIGMSLTMPEMVFSTPQALQHPISNLRKEAALALGEIRSSSALPALANIQDDADPDVRKAARQAIRQIRATPQ